MLNYLETQINNGHRVSDEEALWLYEKAPLDWLKKQANLIYKRRYNKRVFFNRNVHFEPTNMCIYSCKFCSFYRKVSDTKEQGAWDYSLEDLEKVLLKYKEGDISEIHITGGIYPNRGLDWATILLKKIKSLAPWLHIKAFTAVELAWFCKFSKTSLEEGLKILIQAGLDSLPGGGAEIFDPKIRHAIAGKKVPDNQWLEIHEIAHKLGIKSNATMLYGHIEKYEHRIDHMSKIRDLQDKTGGFNCFIPLKYLDENNILSSSSKSISVEEDQRCFAISRIYLDNINHLKAYWVMLGVKESFDMLDFGVDDLDGTIDDSTKIYSMAGGIEIPTLNREFIINTCLKKGKEAVERDSLYNQII